MTDQAEYYHQDNWGGKKCKPGNKHEPKRCDYHPKHFWCRTCEGFYGVPHDGIHEGPKKHPLDNPSNCVCRPCRELLVARATHQPPKG